MLAVSWKLMDVWGLGGIRICAEELKGCVSGFRTPRGFVRLGVGVEGRGSNNTLRWRLYI